MPNQDHIDLLMQGVDAVKHIGELQRAKGLWRIKR
jgi:hypothetical protein